MTPSADRIMELVLIATDRRVDWDSSGDDSRAEQLKAKHAWERSMDDVIAALAAASDSQPQRATESLNERWAAYLSMEREAQAGRRSTEWTAIEAAFEAEIELIAPDQRAPFYAFWKRMKEHGS